MAVGTRRKWCTTSAARLALFAWVSVLLLATMSHAREAFFSNMFSPDSLMGAGPAARGPPSSTPPGFSDQSAYVSLAASGMLIAVGDFNRDRFIDLVMLNSRTLKDISVLFWDHDAYRFRHAGAGVFLSDIEPKEKASGIKPLGAIQGVHVGDFQNAGSLDLLVHDGKQGRVFFGDGAGNFNASQYVIIPELPSAHALVDADADLVPDLFVAFQNGTRGFWVFEEVEVKTKQAEGGSTPTPAIEKKRQLKYRPWPGGRHRGSDGSDCIVMDPTSIAFVDMDGDCLPDLVIPTSCGLEVWSNPADSGRKFWNLSAKRTNVGSDLKLLGLEVFNANHGDQSLAFADFNSDGTIDIAVPNRNRQDLLIHLNIQKKRRTNALCERDSEWMLDRRTGLSTGLNLRRKTVRYLLRSIEVPPSLHIGDYDLDGLPDILVIDGSSSRPIIFRNLGLWDDKHVRQSMFQRMERKAEEGLSGGNAGAVTGTFFDTDESGRQDMLIVRGGNETRLIWNNMREETDSLFFKGTVLSGLPYRRDPRPFVPVVGNTLKVSYMERGSRERVVRTCSQCGQGGFWQLRMCNCQFGLMRIANYIEELWAGAGNGRRSWTNLMPNSMAVVWAETDGAVGGADAWWMEYFTQRRSSQILRVSALLVVALMVLAVAILVLQQQERKEDREEDERERVRLFNFV